MFSAGMSLRVSDGRIQYQHYQIGLQRTAEYQTGQERGVRIIFSSCIIKRYSRRYSGLSQGSVKTLRLNMFCPRGKQEVCTHYL